jgi:hypothetical protein
MPLEHDDEATTFDPRPWGAQQRILPRSHFARMSGTLQETSIPQIPELIAKRTIPPLPVPVAARAITPLGVPVVAAPVQPPYMPAISFAPLQMPEFTVPIDSTLRVHRRPLTLRSFIAVPLGALVAILVIAIGYRASTIRPFGGAVAAAAVDIAPIAVAPHPGVVSVPVIAPIVPPPIEGVATFEAPVEVERTIPAGAKASAKPARAKRNHRPRKIVAVDTSTPLGNLRPRRY